MSDHEIRRAARLARATGDPSDVANAARLTERSQEVKLKLIDPSAWMTGYEDLPHGATYVRDDGTYFEVIVVTDLDGAEGLVMVESRSCGLDRTGHVLGAMQYADVATRVIHMAERVGIGATSNERRNLRTTIRAILAEALVSYGACDTDETIMVWYDRPAADACPADAPKCGDSSGTSCHECALAMERDVNLEVCECHEWYREAARERTAQKATWDSWLPDGYEKGADGQMHATYEGHDGLVRAIESLGPRPEDRR